MSTIKIKASEIAEIAYSINVCSQVASKMRMHLNGNLPISNEESIKGLVTNFNAGGLESAINHLGILLDRHAIWIEDKATDKT